MSTHALTDIRRSSAATLRVIASPCSQNCAKPLPIINRP